MSPDDERFVYDEFAFFHENLSEYGIELDALPSVERLVVPSADPALPDISALRWGTDEPEVVLLHGGAQNAHTWDTVLLALGRPALAIDLPGHGRSGHRADGMYDARTSAGSVAPVIASIVTRPVLLVGMSLGGLTANAVAAAHPELVDRLTAVDITPGVNADKARDVHDFIAGPQSFASFEEILARTVQFNPTRSVASLRRGILHNAHRMADGSWEWNYDRRQLSGVAMPSMGDLWDDVAAIPVPYLLARGGLSPVVDHDDIAELRRRATHARVIDVPDAGHSIQGDQPLRLTEILRDELAAR